jgi:magnesium-transporting ATPase (P-type)
MSVIVKDSDDRYFLFTKGADSILSPKVTQNSEMIDINREYLVDYAKQGLRTLMMVFKEISIDELKDWEKIYNVKNQ